VTLQKRYPKADQKLIAAYQRIFDLLADETVVLQTLQSLEGELYGQHLNKQALDLDAALRAAERRSGFEVDDGLPLLMGFVNSEDFLKILAQRRPFYDFVDKAHGAYSHRIQWYIVMKTIDEEHSHNAAYLYSRIGQDGWWKSSDERGPLRYDYTTSVWDDIVDRDNTVSETWTSPEKLNLALREGKYKGRLPLLSVFLSTQFEAFTPRRDSARAIFSEAPEAYKQVLAANAQLYAKFMSGARGPEGYAVIAEELKDTTPYPHLKALLQGLPKKLYPAPSPPAEMAREQLGKLYPDLSPPGELDEEVLMYIRKANLLRLSGH
jgi:hypothetical protein